MFQFVKSLFYVDPVSTIMLVLVGFVGVCIASYAFRYMKGDSRYKIFFSYLAVLIASTMCMAMANNLILFFVAWCVSNFTLVRMMIHKSSWEAAKKSGLLAAKNYLIGACCIGLAFLLFYFATGAITVSAIVQASVAGPMMIGALLLLTVGAMTQSAILPFHKWLVSSLNSPTPVSALMHAGIVNGGGFLLVKFGSLFLQVPLLLTAIFVVGIVTSLVGTFWKLMQTDVKRMLACSTMGQMGFMLAQVGLGLFPVAIAHLFTHGLFKAYLFLSSGSAASEKKYKKQAPRAFVLLASLACGLLGSFIFSLVSGKPWFYADSSLVLSVLVFITASQFALPILSMKNFFKAPLALILTSIGSVFYGINVSLVTKIMKPMNLMQPQPLNKFHVLAIVLLVSSWVSMLFIDKIKEIKFLQPLLTKMYVANLNASQPCPGTVTTHRNKYKYL